MQKGSAWAKGPPRSNTVGGLNSGVSNLNLGNSNQSAPPPPLPPAPSSTAAPPRAGPPKTKAQLKTEKEEREKKRREEKEAKDKQREQWEALGDTLPRGDNPTPTTNTFPVTANYFHLKIQPECKFHYYEIDIGPIGKPKNPPNLPPKPELKKKIIKNILAQNPPEVAVWASDYQKFIISIGPLFKKWAGMHQDTAALLMHKFATFGNEPSEYQTPFKYKGIIDLKKFEKHCTDNSEQHHMPVAEVNRCTSVLNAITWKNLNDDRGNQSFRGGLIGNKFFPGETKEAPFIKISPEVYSIRTGFFTSVRPAKKGVLLNVQPTTSAFYNPINLAKWIDLYWNRVPGTREFVQRLRGVKVVFKFDMGPTTDEKRRRSIWSISSYGTIERQTFIHDEQERTRSVYDYLSEKYGTTVKRGFTCIDLGSNGDPSWYPAELLEIVDWQPLKGLLDDPRFSKPMVRVAKREPNKNQDLIVNRARDYLGLGQPPFLQRFKIIAETSLLGVSAKSSTIPMLQLKENCITTQYGAWSIQNQQFVRVGGDRYQPADILGVLWTGDNVLKKYPTDGVEELRTKLVSMRILKSTSICKYDTANLLGLGREDIVRVLDGKYAPLISSFKKPAAPNQRTQLPVLLVVITPGYERLYPDIKYWADCHAGIRTQCVTLGTLGKMSPPPDGRTLGNVCMKFNFKLGGMNHHTEDLWCGGLADTMYVGADVTHPGMGSDGCPSMAGVVATRDEFCVHYLASARLQLSKQEFISDLQDMIKERVLAWFHHNRTSKTVSTFPKNIIVYRDGVSESQLGMVLDKEHPQVFAGFKDAVEELRAQKLLPPNFKNERPKEMFLVATKRHHTRFYPKKKDTKNLACGTVVDRDVLNPNNSGFHLQSHQSPIGTAKNGLYTVVYSDLDPGSKIPTDRLQNMEKITNNLCYTGSRATVALSIATPARYADILCDRLREYMKPALAGSITMSTDSPSVSDYSNHGSIWKDPNAPAGRQNPWHKNMDNIMFYL